MVIIEEQVKHIAKLSKLSLSGEESADSTDRLDKVIDMVELLEEVDITGISFTSNTNESVDVMHKDVATPEMDRKKLVQSALESENGYIKVPAIMNNGEAGV